MFKNIITRMKRVNTRKMVVLTAFAVAMVGAAGLGYATKQSSSAATIRECNDNAILKCGAADAKEFISDVKALNAGTKKQADLQMIYNHFGLTPDKYARFEQTARQGLVYRDGRVVVDGQTVMTKSESIGREKFNSHRMPYKIKSNTYYTSQNDVSYGPGVNSIPAMVMFDAYGEVEAVIMNPCGNPVHGEKVKNKFECKSLNKTAVSGKQNTYKFNTTVVTAGNVSVAKLVYDFGDGTTATTTNPNDYVEHTFTKNSTVTVTITYNLPGKKTATVKCSTAISFVAPFFACVKLIPTARNDEKTDFRFTVTTSQGNGATLKDVDFTFNGATTTGVTTKDSQGNIYRDYSIAKDGKQYKVVAKVNFNIAGGVQSKTCEATVTAEKTPMCEIPGKEMYPPNAPECAYCEVPGYEDLPKDSPKCAYCEVPGFETLPKDSPKCVTPKECKPGIPENDARCVETPPVVTPPAELPKTGMGSFIGLVAGVGVAGGAAHHIISSRRRS